MSRSAKSAPPGDAGAPGNVIRVVGAAEHNLQNVSLTLPRDSLTVFTGVSGSGKSSLAFDTLFKEGQRRFLESLSPYARQFLGQMEKPKVEHVEGLSPTISIDQKTVNRNPRSTVGTITELYDHYRLLFARFGQPHCPNCHVPISTLTPEQIADRLLVEFGPPTPADGSGNGQAAAAEGPATLVFAPMVRERKGEYRKELSDWLAEGFLRARIDGEMKRLDEPIALARYEKHTIELVLDRFRMMPANRSRLTEALEKAIQLAKGLVIVQVEETERLFSSSMACATCGQSIPELEPRLFSFNDPQGACGTCNGLGTLRLFSERRLADPALSLAQGALQCFTEKGNLVFTDIDRDDLLTVAKALKIDTRKAWGKLPQKQRDLLLHGNSSTELKVRNVFRNPMSLIDEARRAQKWVGVTALLRYVERFVGGFLERYQEETECPDCHGRRLSPVALAVTFRDQNIDQLSRMTVEDSVVFFAGLALDATEQVIGKDIFREIRGRLGFLNDVGVGYLSLERKATTLSGGEAQRIRLASQVGSGLQGVLYVLDEPSIGLHQTDNRKLIGTLQRLRDAGNTVFVVEHDQETITSADHVVDLGPGAGSQGGQVLAAGSVADLIANRDSISGRYLGGTESIPLPVQRRAPGEDWLTVKGARRHNLKDLEVGIPLGLLVAVTGVSGSGKSTLVHEILMPALSDHLNRRPLASGDFDAIEGLAMLDKVIEIDQSPIGRTPRSNPATYTKVLDQIRGLFAGVPEAKIRGYKPGRFSFNVKGGRCEACEGAGVRTIEMQFLSAVEVVCEECLGRRFNEETLQITYKGQTIHQVLEMTVDEAAAFFTNIPAAARILTTLQDVGLGYIKLGQPSTTLSGGEAQRVKLASELRKRSTGHTLYLLDEPTTGLHFHDIKTLLGCLNALVEQGNTVLVIEHNLDVIKVADHVIDLGPGGGARGGRLVGQGTPEQLADAGESLTGQVLRDVLHPQPLAAGNGAHPVEGRALRDLVVRGAEKNNLRHVDVTVPRNKLTVITGVSGSGKTSLAFDTIFAEGQARYVESLSTYARRFLGRMDKARVDGIDGLAPAIAIDQKNSGRSPRSTVATITEIYDYLRLLYARIGLPHCPVCGAELHGANPTRLARDLAQRWPDAAVIVQAPLYRPGSHHASLLDTPKHLEGVAPSLLAEGFTRVSLGGELVRLEEWLALPKSKRPLKADMTVDLVIDRVRITGKERKRLAEAIEGAFAKGHGLARLVFPEAGEASSGAKGKGRGKSAAGSAGNGAGTATPALGEAGGLLMVAEDGGTDAAAALPAEWLVSEQQGCVAHDYYLTEALTPRMFSFNSHVGACEECAGLGRAQQVDPDLLVPFPEHPLLEGALVPGKLGQALGRRGSKPERALATFAKREGIPLHKPFGSLSGKQQQLLLFGDGEALSFTKRSAWSGRRRAFHTTFEGLTGIVLDWYRSEFKAKWLPLIDPVMADVACRACGGERLKPEYRAVTLAGRSISGFCALNVEEALADLAGWKLARADQTVAEQPLQEIRSRLGFLRDVGLGYLTLDREAMTLSGGEAQRIRLASQLGANLVGVLYVLDEPTIGLHPRDTGRLLGTLKRLRDTGNTVLVVEHDPETMDAADHLIDIGPGAGHLGGMVVATGNPKELRRHPESLTGAYLSGRKGIAIPPQPRRWNPKAVLRVVKARANNLQDISVDFPLGAFTAVTGVSGSGKSSLVVEVLQKGLERKLGGARVVPGAHEKLEGLQHVDKLVVIDQSPIGKSPKSNPATYTGAMDKIRTLMSRMPEAKRRGYSPGRFSFNMKGGRCEACEGRGFNHIEMHFLADVWVPCEVCEGRRYNRETLQVSFRGKHIADILDMEIGDALELFANQSGIRRSLASLADVGLGYMKLGQAGTTLSGGEAQRVKLASELGRPTGGRTVYILDEPTTGLHLDDTAKLLTVLHRLVDGGNTVIVIEHNLDVIKTADHVIDLGPEGGDGGGLLLATGTPRDLAQVAASHTGQALRKVFRLEKAG